AVGVQDTAGAPGTGHSDRLRLVPEPPARGREGAARRAVQSSAGPLPLLRGARQPPEPGLSGIPRALRVVYLAAPSQPADAPEAGEVQGPVAVLSSAPSSDRGADLGTIAVSRLVRQSRMVEISLSGSREGPGRATGRGYSTRDERTAGCLETTVNHPGVSPGH